MAYDQGYYQQPQRPYNGRAAQRPGPSQGYGQPPPPQQQYASQDYEQYPQDGHGYDNGYAQDHNGNRAYQDMNPGGRGNGYAPQNQNYPPQQDYYGSPRGGGGMPPANSGRGGPMQRPPTADGPRGGYDQRNGGRGRGYPNGGGPMMGRGGRPAPLDRSASSDPGMRAPRKPLKTPPMTPDQAAWDNPFPTFPGSKKKTSMSEEQKIIQQMASIDVGGPASKSSQNRYHGGPGSDDDYGPPSLDSQRGMAARGQPPQGPPQQGYPDQRRGPQGSAPNGYREPAYNDRGGYGAAAPISPLRSDFGPAPSRSMTMPNELSIGMSAGRQPPMLKGGPAPEERPYNGPIGRGMPPRPSTATGTRQPPQRTYPNVDPQENPADAYASGKFLPNQSQAHHPGESISDFYDSYYDSTNGRDKSNASEMPNFDAGPVNLASRRRGGSIDDHIQPGSAALQGNSFGLQNGYKQIKPMKSQPDFRAQPQAAVFDMASDAPPLPNAYSQRSYSDDRFGPQSGQYNGQPGNLRGPPPAQEYGRYDEPPSQNGFSPQGMSSGPRNNGPGLPMGPKSIINGLPNGQSSQNGTRPNGLPQPALSPDALPSHPPPIRAGLIPNSVANQANNKPPPFRNYNNATSPQQPASSQPAPQAAPAAPPQVTLAELDQMKNAIKVNPNDQATQMLLARKLVEACDVLVPSIPDQRARNKTREKYVMDAHKLLKKLVVAQNIEAMFYLADSYGRGALGLEADNKEAFSLYQSAAKAGHAGAAYRTAVCCELGNEEGGGTRKDPLKAIQWYKRAAMLGDTPGMYKMGMILLKGLLGQPKNPREAVGWLKRAAERADAENPHALHELGLLYEQPQGGDGSIVRDEAYSFSLFQQAAELGYKFSQFRMGCAYEYGLFNCPIDPRQSIMWYSRAAIQEEHQSELALSGWYLTGSEGVLQQSDTEAYLWARKAAMAGLAKAEYAMGYFTEVGIGSPASLEDAKRWYWRAAAQNFPKARERLEDLKRGGSRPTLKSRERISRSKVGKQNEGECSIM